ncbi:hypothetical protein ULF88_02720 [Halopseudomonas pachastrellae]|nr:hypothetical protein [Halopseudomonas pachastrellae]
MSQALPVMLQAQRSGHTDSAMEQALLAVFQPLRVERLSHKAQRPQVVDNGDALQAPGHRERRTICCATRIRGADCLPARMFNWLAWWCCRWIAWYCTR